MIDRQYNPTSPKQLDTDGLEWVEELAHECVRDFLNDDVCEQILNHADEAWQLLMVNNVYLTYEPYDYEQGRVRIFIHLRFEGLDEKFCLLSLGSLDIWRV